MDDELRKPVLPGEGRSDYERYLRTDELLSLQKTPSESVHRDELLFQTVHQASELWLKLACAEVDEATNAIARGELGGAARLLRRAIAILPMVTEQLHVLEHLSPWEYQRIREVLGHGSGFDSPGFRQVQHVSPRLGEAFRALVSARGLTLLDLYQREREFEAEYQLAELLTSWDEQIALWRFHHLKVVERIIGGHVIGTQGTPVEVLARRVPLMFFEDLWDVRNRLTEAAHLHQPAPAQPAPAQPAASSTP
jgi:tryptophan 2,3-dioxygenase